MNKEEIDMLNRAIDTHVSMLRRIHDEIYKNNRKRENQSLVIPEIRKYKELKKKLKSNDYEKY